ncbi:non-ribosomal peptide synthetase [Paenibacillus sp. FSL R5-0912]|uniref:non-ribosomal peptide synthetase n=1 Tax=Paenibacillus sp. FSL R5-0912 TaxID=1536771 RepID=UPI000A51B242|nr:non-ribosomal peptide synthetase [Paenibacillus sp. FSL R5-0912]
MEQTLERTQKLQLAEAILRDKLGLTGDSIPVSKGQEGLFLQYRLSPDSCAYHLNFCSLIDNQIRIDLLRESFRILRDKHPILRTGYRENTGGPYKVVQQVMNGEEFWMVHEVFDLEEETIDQLVHERSKHPFDLENGKVMRVDFFEKAEGQGRLLVSIHHIAMDYWSQGVLLNELGLIFTSLVEHGKAAPGTSGVLYSEFAKWQGRLLASKEGRHSLDYWKETLNGLLPCMDLPTDYPRGDHTDYRGQSCSFELSPKMVDGIRRLAGAHEATVYVIMLAFYYMLLQKYSGQKDIIIGSPTTGRSSARFKDTIGYLVNMLPLRIDADSSLSFPELVAYVKQVSMEGLTHGDIPFFNIVRELQGQRNGNRTPVFQVSLTYEKPTSSNRSGRFLYAEERPSIQLGSLVLHPVPVPVQASQYELSLYLEEVEGSLSGQFHYQSALFKEETVQRMALHYVQLISEVLDKPELEIGAYPIITKEEREKILNVWNYPAAKSTEEETLHSRIHKMAEQFPARTAVVCGQEEITYSELNLKSSILAACLQAKGVGPEVKVPLMVQPSLDMIVAILAVLKAGGTYVPIHHQAPPERIAEIIQDIQPVVMITERGLATHILAGETDILYADGDWNVPEPAEMPESNHDVTADNTAYIIYTSGSTGKPKGVMVSHRNAVRLFTSTQQRYNFDERDTWTLFHSFSFDFSVWEIFGALLYGGKLVVVPYYVTREPHAFYRLLSSEGVTVLNQTPSAFKQLMNVDQSLHQEFPLALRYVIFGGEALDLQSLRPWFERHGDKEPALVNMYGITETTVHVTYRPVVMADTEFATGSYIGEPIPDLQIYLLDDYRNLVPPGVHGEIYVGGAGVSKGYFNRPELTAERFINDFIGGISGNRLYRSGDMGRYLPNGDIEYLGRQDSQVKIRGFRIELGEIRSRILAFNGIKDAVILVDGSRDEDKKIVAYVIWQGQELLDSGTLRKFLKGKLPDYMIPSAFLAVEEIPLNANGKIDRTALPPVVYGILESNSTAVPETELQRKLACLWEEVLSLDQVGIDQAFFDMGGNSILVVELHNRIKDQLCADISIADLFQYSTVAEQAGHIESMQSRHKDDQTLHSTAGIIDKQQLRKHAMNRRTKP